MPWEIVGIQRAKIILIFRSQQPIVSRVSTGFILRHSRLCDVFPEMCVRAWFRTSQSDDVAREKPTALSAELSLCLPRSLYVYFLLVII